MLVISQPIEFNQQGNINISTNQEFNNLNKETTSEKTNNSDNSITLLGNSNDYYYKITNLSINKETQIPYNQVYENKTQNQEFKVESIEDKHILFIGDSRFVEMKQVNTNENYDFYCKVGKGWEWYKSNLSNIEKLIDDDTIIIFALGINDLGNIEKYKTLQNSQYFKQMYFLSVNPVDESKEKINGYTIKNSNIETFNNTMKNIFEDKYIDSNSYLSTFGFSTQDGVHYTNNTYVMIYDYILNILQNNLYPTT